MRRFNWNLNPVTTLEVQSKDAIPEGSRELEVSLESTPSPTRLFAFVVATIIVSFLITRLDAVSSSEGVRQFIIGILNQGSLYTPFFPDRFWSPVTCMWLHGNFFHIANNLGMMVGLWFLLRRPLGGNWWLLIFIVGGALGNLAHLATHINPPGDYANWHGASLDLLFMEHNTPLAGASGGVMALWGAAIAVALRFRLDRGKGVVDRADLGLIALVLPAVIQLFWFDWTSKVAVAGFAHQMGMVAGFLLALPLPLRGNSAVYASSADVVGVRTISIKGRRNIVVSGLSLILKPEFKDDADFVIITQEMFGGLFGKGRRSRLCIGTPFEGEREVFVVADCKQVTGYKITSEK